MLEKEAGMKGYLFAEIEITDPEAYKQYMQLAPPAIAAFGGRYLVRGGEPELIEGEPPPKRTVLLEFESPAHARAFLRSPQYQKAAAIRRRASRGRFLLLTGVAAPA